MSRLTSRGKRLFEQAWQETLSEYITAIVWSPQDCLAASSAAGEVVIWQDHQRISLLKPSFCSIDCLAFSSDGEYLAAAGQAGKVYIWKIGHTIELISTLDYAPKWLDHLGWSPIQNILAFSIGSDVQIWDAETGQSLTNIAFESSSVLGMSWRPNGQDLALAGNGGVKVWSTINWDEEPFIIDLPAASIAIAWSTDGQYLASGSLDYTITVLNWNTPNLPWVMRGFPGKIRNLAWSQPINGNTPLLAASSVEGVAVWKKATRDEEGWTAEVLTSHENIVLDLAFQPNSLLLASAGAEGRLFIWENAKRVGQVLEGVKEGFSCLAWCKDGQHLASGGQAGEVMVWSRSSTGKGFGG